MPMPKKQDAIEGDAEAAGEALQGVSGGRVGGPAPSDEAGGGSATGGAGKPRELKRDIDATDAWDAERG